MMHSWSSFRAAPASAVGAPASAGGDFTFAGRGDALGKCRRPWRRRSFAKRRGASEDGQLTFRKRAC
eukprot:2474919-Alexandrium_andersonii.AAC.1